MRLIQFPPRFNAALPVDLHSCDEMLTLLLSP